MTLRTQCWLFAIGAAFFALATAPGVFAGAATVTNVLCFVGSWFFTSAAYIQMQLASDRLDRWASESQFVGTVLFNISTGASVWAHRIPAERRFVWTPDAFGSALFLVSSVLAIVALAAACTARDRLTAWINMAGSVAFGVSALGAFIRRTGVTADQWLANTGTFLGALCFLVAALLALPRERARSYA